MAKMRMSFRIDPEDLATMKRYAAELGLDLTAYVVEAGTQRLDLSQDKVGQRLARLEGAVKRLEELAYGSVG